jgi:hypothetical protein
MLRYTSLECRTGTHLPENHWAAHELCFKIHDVMTQLLVSGESASAFRSTVTFHDEADRLAFERAGDIFEWLGQSRSIEELGAALISTVFPAVLSDMLHCFYEALETSRKAKLTVTFMLLRKPLQESLFLLETVVADRFGFAKKLTAEPSKLGSQRAGGLEAHTLRIQKVLDQLGEGERFDAGYLARLRYDKEAADGFDGVCNKAIHLFTDHKSIRTEPLNINFIFSQTDSRLTQWAYLYSRLPYLLVYMHRIVEYVCASIAPTDPIYLHDIDRRIAALVLLWWHTVEAPYNEPHLHSFVDGTRDWLFKHCKEAGFRVPTHVDLTTMALTGAYPGETQDNF